MTAPVRSALYTPDLLALAVSLAEFPLDPALPIRGEARSATCGSTVMLGCALDRDGRLDRVGLRARACAVGQASAALFAQAAPGRNRDELATARHAIAGWLAGEGARPAWPGFGALEAARGYPARHGAILLAWDAALAALSKADAGG